MKSVKELNKIADSAAKDAVGTIRAVTDELSFVEADRFIRSETALGEGYRRRRYMRYCVGF